ncbi:MULTISPECIES: STAS domain-containing protein [Catenuloplanes]|uniref:Anti-anti-sigma factor n=1 Tax=Catenuloplanes niger TaxID=587534 RepID=A0AAE3ZMZ4_9ACTN|nr:STAS domain-containing protein [Catenuloplanes niger]MDR7320805.1 anti-anti-sigma factor [Catenuloplanes niger]
MFITVDDRYRRAAVITLHGEFDISGVDAVTEAVETLFSASRRYLLVDLHHLAFLDMAATGALLRCRAAAACAGVDLQIAGSRGFVRRVLDIAGVLPLLERAVARDRFYTTLVAVS